MPISITKQNRRFICDYTTIGRLPLTTFWGKKKSNVLTSIKIQKSVTGTRCIQLHLFFFQTEVLAFMYVHIISSVEINKYVYTQTCHCITGKYPSMRFRSMREEWQGDSWVYFPGLSWAAKILCFSLVLLNSVWQNTHEWEQYLIVDIVERGDEGISARSSHKNDSRDGTPAYED